jgi:transcriptional regulator GlxA family with amidase domain
MHTVAILAIHGFIPYDLSIPCSVFKYTGLPNGNPAYEVHVCGMEKEVKTSAYSLCTTSGLRRLVSADTVIIPGIEDITRPVPPKVLAAIRTAYRNGARIASICTGAFVLAETGLLNGRRATTHWSVTKELARRFPEVEVDPQVLYVDEGRVITSAGASAGLDMCLRLVRLDYGPSVAADTARMLVAPLERDGGQAQFIRHKPPASNASLAPFLEWMRKNIHKNVDVETMASRACVSPRTFARRFREQTGTTPLHWVTNARVTRAQELLESTANSIEEVAMAIGFDSPVTFRTRFRQMVGLSPSAYRARFSAEGKTDDHKLAGRRKSKGYK